jgi:hypothetical protein
LLPLAFPDTTGFEPLDAIFKAINASLETLNAGFEPVNACLYITNPGLEFRETRSEARHFGFQAADSSITRSMSRAMVCGVGCSFIAATSNARATVRHRLAASTRPSRRRDH